MSVPDPVSVSLWGRLRGTVKGALLGFVLFVLAFPLLLWNEGGAIVNQQQADLETKYRVNDVISIGADDVQQTLEGRLVHLSGELTPIRPPEDPEFGTRLPVLKLQRQVETYQWVEIRRPGETPDTIYAKVWRNEPVDSSKFAEPETHRNSVQTSHRDWEGTADAAQIGKFAIPADLINTFNPFEPLPLGESGEGLSETMAAKGRIHDGLFYFSKEPAHPQIGDVRVRFIGVKSQIASIIGQQIGNSVGPYFTKDGREVYQLRPGKHSASEMYAEIAPSGLLSLSTFLTFVLRGCGFALLAAGLFIMLERFGTWGVSVPIVRDMLAPGKPVFIGVVAAALGLATIGFAWLSYSWLRGGFLLAFAIAALLALRYRGRDIRSQVAETKAMA